MKRISVFICIVSILISCDEKINLPSVGEVTISDITNNSVVISFLVANNGNASIDTIGICISKNENPTIEDQVYVRENVSELKYTLTDLIPKTEFAGQPNFHRLLYYHIL